jgi:hypothetical protein
MRTITHKTVGWLVIPVSLLLLAGCATQESPTPQQPTARVASHEEDARHVPGSPFEQVFSGQADIVVLTFFDLYCVACQQSANAFKVLYNRVQDELPEVTTQMTGIGVGDTEFELQVFQRKYELQYNCLPDPEKAFEEPFALRGTPTVLVFHRDSGKCTEIFRNEGRFRTSDIDKLLEAARKKVSP